MKREFSQTIVAGIGVLLGFNALWLLLSWIVKDPMLPSPLEVYRSFSHLWGKTALLEHLLASLQRLFWGIFWAIACALPVAVLMYRYPLWRRLLSIFIYLSYPIPKLALLPIIILFMGLGDASKVTMIVLIIVFQLMINLRDAFREIPRDSLAILRSLGASFYEELKLVVLPTAQRAILSSLRVAVGTAISVLFVSETFGTFQGLGYFVMEAWGRMDYISMYTGILVLSLVGFLLFALIDLLQYFTTPKT